MNLTVSVNGETLRKARIRAIEENTSVNAVLREHLEWYAGNRLGQGAARRIRQRSQNATSRRGGATWSRNELHPPFAS